MEQKSTAKLEAESAHTRKRKRSRTIILSCRTIGIMTFAFSIVWGIVDRENAGQSFMNAFTAFLFVVLSFLPNLLNAEFKLHIPATLQAVIVLFIFAAEILGEIHNFYDLFFWWDVMLHTFSGFIIGYIGFLIIYTLNRNPNVQIQMSLFGVCAFAFCFALACGAFWEIFEWSGDMLLGMNMQKGVYVKDVSELAPYINRWGRFMDPGLVDTMEDIIVDAVGALTAAIFGYFTIRKSRSENLPLPDTFD